MTPHSLSVGVMTGAVIVCLESDVLQGRNGSKVRVDQLQCVGDDFVVVQVVESKLRGNCAIQVRPQRGQVGAAALHSGEDAEAALVERDMVRVHTDEGGKVNDEMPDIGCVVDANLLKEGDYFLGGDLGEIEVILAVEQRAGFAVDDLVGAEQRQRGPIFLLSRGAGPGIRVADGNIRVAEARLRVAGLRMRVDSPGIDRLLVQ